MTSRPREPIVGREREKKSVLDALAAEARLLTITGVAGVGKSRLLRELGANAAFAVADVSEIASIDAFVDRIARALGFDEIDSLARLTAALDGAGPIVLGIDGLDGLLESARSVFGQWLEQIAELSLVVTSRTQLRLSAEQLIELEPLAVPHGNQLEGEAAQLFLRAVRRARADYAPSPADAPFVAELIRELDGLPLALELAAPRLGVMAPAALLHRLRQSRSLLQSRNLDGPSRHRSFDIALEGSWQSLSSAEQCALAELSVFAGGFTLDHAEAVLELGSGAPSTLEVIQSLRERSLLFALAENEAAELRLGLLRGVADFVRRRSDPQTLAAARARHAAHFGMLASRVSIDRERDNLMAVIRGVLESGPVTAKTAEPALSALAALAPGLEPSPGLAAYSELLERVLDATQNSGAEPQLIARALGLRGAFRRRLGRLAEAAHDLDRALRIAETVGARDLAGLLLRETASVLADAGELERARERAADAVSILSEAGTRGDEASALGVLGRIESARRLPAAALGYFERALALAPSLVTHADLARVLADLGERDRARAEIRRARALGGAPGALAELEMVDGVCAHDEGDLRSALAHYETASSCARGAGQGEIEARGLELSAAIAIEQRAFARAHALLRSADEAAGGARAPLGPSIRTALAHAARVDRAAIGQVKAELEPLRAAFAIARIVARAVDRGLGGSHERAPEPPPSELVIGAGGRWFRPPHGSAIGLERRRPLAAILDHLAKERALRPGSASSWESLRSVAWPGERMIESAAAHRVRVAVSSLRKLGLRDLVLTSERGYLLDPKCPLTRVDEATD